MDILKVFKNMDCYLYAKFAGEASFRAFDLQAGNFAGKLIYCSIIADSAENTARLQRIAERNAATGVTFQLREPATGCPVFETRPARPARTSARATEAQNTARA